jgi:hypothetical protein
MASGFTAWRLGILRFSAALVGDRAEVTTAVDNAKDNNLALAFPHPKHNGDAALDTCRAKSGGEVIASRSTMWSRREIVAGPLKPQHKPFRYADAGFSGDVFEYRAKICERGA